VPTFGWLIDLPAFATATELVDRYAWATPTPEALRVLRQFAPIVEMGCGANAYWAQCMQQQGIDVLAYDVNVKSGGKLTLKLDKEAKKSRSSASSSVRVHCGGPSVLAQHTHRTLFLCYPDEEGDGMAAECLEHYTGQYVIHVGETIWDANLSVDQCPWGRSSAADFQQRLATEFHCILKLALPSWLHVNDSISVWKRTQTSTMVFAADSDDDADDTDEEAEYRHIPPEERLPVNVAAPCCAHLLPTTSPPAVVETHHPMPSQPNKNVAVTTPPKSVQASDSEQAQQSTTDRKEEFSAFVTNNTASASVLVENAKSPPTYHDYCGEALAPMVRASTIPLRILALQYGADFCYTEELVDRSITETVRVENKRLGTIDYLKDTSNVSAKVQRRLAREGGPPLLLRIDPQREAGKLACQIGSGEPELALAAALHVHKDVSSIDVNMGWYVAGLFHL
jgi:hypothetical protein